MYNNNEIKVLIKNETEKNRCFFSGQDKLYRCEVNINSAKTKKMESAK
jgi:hypothetical protein